MAEGGGQWQIRIVPRGYLDSPLALTSEDGFTGQYLILSEFSSYYRNLRSVKESATWKQILKIRNLFVPRCRVLFLSQYYLHFGTLYLFLPMRVAHCAVLSGVLSGEK